MRSFCLFPILLAALSAPVAAQSSLGLNFFEASVAAGDDGAYGVGVTGDYRITGHHGLEVDLSGYRVGSDLLAQVDAHLYMQPGDDTKYGVFLSVADLNDRSGTIGVAGVEGMAALGEATVVSGRMSAGLAQPQGLDFVALEGGISRAVGPGAIYASAALTVVDEAALRTTAWAAELGYAHSVTSTGIDISAGIGATGLGGAQDDATELSARIGVIWRFGGERGPRRPLADRSFGVIRPLDPLLARSIF